MAKNRVEISSVMEFSGKILLIVIITVVLYSASSRLSTQKRSHAAAPPQSNIDGYMMELQACMYSDITSRRLSYDAVF